MHGYRVQSVGSLGVSGRRHAFELIPPDSRLMYFYFVAETETEMREPTSSHSQIPTLHVGMRT